MRPRVLFVATHPIQYQVPLFRSLAACAEVEFSVLYVQLPNAEQQGVGFGVAFQWDIPMLEGYPWRQVPALSGKQGLRGYFSARILRPGALLRELQPDVVILSGWHAWPMIQMLLAARLRRLPVVMRGESNSLRRRSWMAQCFHRALLGRCAAFLTIGKSNRAFYSGYGVEGRKLFDTSYFVDNDRFVEAAAQLRNRREYLRGQWGIPPGAACFCYAGKLEPKKRVMDLLAALQQAVGRSPRMLHLLVVGSGELLEMAIAYVEKHKLPVTFAGFLNQSEIPAAYVAADCLVLPSDFGETWGLVVNEAMACGRPALVSDRVGCGPDLIVTGITGATFPFGNTESLAAKLVEFASDPVRLELMGIAAREHVTRKYTVENAAQGTLAAVRHVLDPA